MWKPDVCIYHGNCDDGFGAAWSVRRRWPDVKFVPGVYGKPLPDCAGANVLFVDFSAKRPEIDALAQSAHSIVIIDHHKTAEADLEPFKVTLCGSARFAPNDLDGMFRDMAELGRPPILAWFDKQFSAALRTYPMEFQGWDEFVSRGVVERLFNEGAVILHAHRANIEKFMAEAYMTDIAGHVVPVVNVPYHYASDTAHEMLGKFPDAPFAACWFRRGDGMIQYSLRSEDRRQDVSEVAKAFGGGGHRNAAGYQVKA